VFRNNQRGKKWSVPLHILEFLFGEGYRGEQAIKTYYNKKKHLLLSEEKRVNVEGDTPLIPPLPVLKHL
jgi:hypothetical protein